MPSLHSFTTLVLFTFALVWTSLLSPVHATKYTNLAVAEKLTAGAASLNVPAGRYYIQNVATGQRLTYSPTSGRRPAGLYASKNGSPITVRVHAKNGGKSPWVKLEIGAGKCISSGWSGSVDGMAIPYACNEHVRHSTLEPTKQWWMFVPVGHPLGHAQAGSGAMLMAAQMQSVKTRNKAHHWAKRLERLVKRGGRGGGIGPVYIVPTDHLADQSTRVLSGGVTHLKGATEGRIDNWRQGNKAQQWELIRA